MKTIYTITETRVSVYPRYELEPIGPEEILYCWNSGDFCNPRNYLAMDTEEDFEDTPRMFDSLEEATTAFKAIRPQSISAEPAGDSAVRFNGRDCDCPWVFRNVSIWTLEEVTYDDDGQCVARAWLYEKADECIA